VSLLGPVQGVLRLIGQFQLGSTLRLRSLAAVTTVQTRRVQDQEWRETTQQLHSSSRKVKILCSVGSALSLIADDMQPSVFLSRSFRCCGLLLLDRSPLHYAKPSMGNVASATMQ